MHYTRFFVRTRDPSQVKLLKLKILLQLASSENISILVRELKVSFFYSLGHGLDYIHQDYCLDTDDVFAAESMRAIGRCTTIVPDSTQQCLNILIEFIRSPYGKLKSNRGIHFVDLTIR